MKKYLTIPLTVLVLGILAGAGAGLLSLFLGRVEQLFLSFDENAAHPMAVNALPIQRLLSVFIGGVIVAIIWWLIRRRETQIPKIVQVMQGQEMPFWRGLAHVFLQIFYVGTGGSVGRELAPRELGALFAQKWSIVLKKLGFSELSTEDRALIVAAAAGAGFAGAYIAPVTGMFFCIEILHKKISTRAVAISLSMSVIAMIVGGLIKGTEPYYQVGSQNFSLFLLLFVLVVASICGLVGAYFRKAFLWAEAHQVMSKQILWQLPLASLLTGIIASVFPEIMGNGRALAQQAMSANSEKLIPILLLLALLKGPVTVMTIRAGAAGGTLTPAIGMGASIGAVVALLIPGMTIWQGAMVGAVAFLASAQQAPLMALFMLIEVSHLPLDSVVPLGLAVALAMATSQLILRNRTLPGLEDE